MSDGNTPQPPGHGCSDVLAVRADAWARKINRGLAVLSLEMEEREAEEIRERLEELIEEYPSPSEVIEEFLEDEE